VLKKLTPHTNPYISIKSASSACYKIIPKKSFSFIKYFLTKTPFLIYYFTVYKSIFKIVEKNTKVYLIFIEIRYRGKVRFDFGLLGFDDEKPEDAGCSKLLPYGNRM
jgi:hypothetical protein